MSGRLAGERAVVVGAGVSGAGAAQVLLTEGASVLVVDERPAKELERAEALRTLGADVVGGGADAGHLAGATVLVVSPGVPEHAPIIGWASERGVPIWGELELGARVCDVPYLAVTGTNGKTTTTELLAQMLRADGRDAIACGNIGHPFPLAAGDGHEALVVEASSFQLRFHETFHPQVSVLLNVAPDHLDWHGSVEAYASAKARIHACQRDADVHVGNLDDPAAAAMSRRAVCEVVWFGLSDEPADGQVGYVEGELLTRLDGVQHLGTPTIDRAGFREDAAAAAAAALSFGVTPSAVSRALQEFSPAAHRGETVATVGGVRFVDNSKATNVHATLAALEGRRDVVLIAGGRSKGADLSALAGGAPALVGVVAIGEAADELVRILEGIVPVHKAGSIEEAVGTAAEMVPPSGTVLLAPACASWDMFIDYAERGERFAAAARSLAAGGSDG